MSDKAAESTLRREIFAGARANENTLENTWHAACDSPIDENRRRFSPKLDDVSC
jgi:hypothetical protein